MSCALRILYHMLGDENRVEDQQVIEERLIQLVNGSFEYFLALSSELHRDSWTTVLLLIFSRILQLPAEKVRYMEGSWNVNNYICDKDVIMEACMA